MPTGTNGDDQNGAALQGTPGNDLYQGLAGDDWLLPTAGDDTLDGGPDRDVAIYSALGIFVNGVFINNTDGEIDGVAARTTRWTSAMAPPGSPSPSPGSAADRRWMAGGSPTPSRG